MPTAEDVRENHEGALIAQRPRAEYTPGERRFSLILRQRLQDLLQGKRNRVEILRKYPRQPDRLGVIATPPDVPRNQLRLPVVERLSWDAIGFVHADLDGGPVSQMGAENGDVVEFQTFPTKYPHIIIERIDRYPGESTEPIEITWSLRRVQNQRAQTQFNRMLDAANLAFEVVRMIF